MTSKLSIFKNYDEYEQAWGKDEVIEKRRKKWTAYKKMGIAVDYLRYVSPGNWLDEIRNRNIGFRWRDHERMIYFNGKPALITSEPYGIPQKYISKLVKVGEELGFSVSINDRFASHVGDTGCCIEIAPFKWVENQRELEGCLGA